VVKIFIAIWIIVSFFCLSSCSNSQSLVAQHRVLDKNTYASAQASDFDGPWANKISQVVSGSESDFVYNILKDSRITDVEFQEIQNSMKTCLANKGFDSKFGGPDVLGSYVVITPNYSPDIDSDYKKGIPDNAVNADSVCKTQTNYSILTSLYYMMLWNPQNEDLSNYTADCLVKLNIAKEGFTVGDFKDKFDLRKGYLALPSGTFGHADEIPGARDTIQDKGDPITKKSTMSIPFNIWNKCTLNPKSVLSEK
jgi:hypothetical protein